MPPYIWTHISYDKIMMIRTLQTNKQIIEMLKKKTENGLKNSLIRQNAEG